LQDTSSIDLKLFEINTSKPHGLLSSKNTFKVFLQLYSIVVGLSFVHEPGGCTGWSRATTA